MLCPAWSEIFLRTCQDTVSIRKNCSAKSIGVRVTPIRSSGEAKSNPCVLAYAKEKFCKSFCRTSRAFSARSVPSFAPMTAPCVSTSKWRGWGDASTDGRSDRLHCRATRRLPMPIRCSAIRASRGFRTAPRIRGVAGHNGAARRTCVSRARSRNAANFRHRHPRVPPPVAAQALPRACTGCQTLKGEDLIVP